MAEAFEPITTQEAFEAAVADRLAPYADYNDLKAQNEALAGQVAELNTRCQTYETDALKTRVAHEVGLPFDLAGRLTGSKEEDIRKDAQNLLQLDALNSANTLREVRAKVSAATGVPADLLSGDTEEACTAQAQAILKFAKPGYPNVRDGGDPHHTPTCSTRQQFADWFEQVTK